MKGRLTPRGGRTSVPHCKMSAQLQLARAELRDNERQVDAAERSSSVPHCMMSARLQPARAELRDDERQVDAARGGRKRAT